MNAIKATWENQYLQLIEEIHQYGEDRVDRTGVGTRALFGKTLDIDLTAGYPLVTTKKMPFKMVKSEQLWFIEGSSDERRLAEIHYGTRDPSKKTIWTDNAQAPYWKPKARFDGDLGEVYGVQWRHWKTYTPADQQTEGYGRFYTGEIDQIAQAIDKIKNNPTDRRIIVSAWNVGELGNMALPPCHAFFQFYVSNDRKLSLQMYQRSVDTMLGLPFNIASYAMLCHMVAQVTDCTVGRLIMQLGDTHIYNDHLHAVPLQVKRIPLMPPRLVLNRSIKNIDDFTMDDITLEDYKSWDAIQLDMAV